MIFKYQIFNNVVKCFRWYFDNLLKNIFFTFNSSWSLSTIRSFCGNTIRASVNKFSDIFLWNTMISWAHQPTLTRNMIFDSCNFQMWIAGSMWQCDNFFPLLNKRENKMKIFWNFILQFIFTIWLLTYSQTSFIFFHFFKASRSMLSTTGSKLINCGSTSKIISRVGLMFPLMHWIM